jgi:hypothetical protein
MKLVRLARQIVCVSVLVFAGCSSTSKDSAVTGYIEPCVGARIVGASALPHAAGTVTALRGRERLRKVADGFQQVLPTSVAARVHVDENQPFRLKLAAGDYVLVGSYDDRGSGTTYLSLTLPRHTTLHRNLPNICK